MSFKITLRTARTNLGLSRKDASKLFDIFDQTLGSYEHDSVNVPMSFYRKIEIVYGVPVEMIYFGNEKEFYEEQRKKLGIEIS